MKRFLSLLLVLALVICMTFCLASCTSDDKDGGDNGGGSSNKTQDVAVSGYSFKIPSEYTLLTSTEGNSVYTNLSNGDTIAIVISKSVAPKDQEFTGGFVKDTQDFINSYTSSGVSVSDVVIINGNQSQTITYKSEVGGLIIYGKLSMRYTRSLITVDDEEKYEYTFFTVSVASQSTTYPKVTFGTEE